ncbi:beta strand repeat-containing protein [Pannonibacter phragmitetus]|uniref:beta strand repeat-containing protein n=2 Tax=Pannonibacter phragmitetus TaxID=121719 RepID=UPI0011C07995|nr:MBG domain-containing protein [Pannonibacter phragmitetus]
MLPTDGSVASGSVFIGSSGPVMTVTQGSNQAIVNWGSFSIGQGNTVHFVQPDASASILNRVTGATASTIAGALNANGQVYLINPNGITITPTGRVTAGGGFVASTLDMSDEDFLKRQYRFSGNGSSAKVSNEGVITIGRGGYAALIGGTVRNDGLIAVPMGKVGLGSGEQATLDLSGDGFLQVALPTAEGAEGDGALVENSGQISAEGGTVVMKAATARHAARHAVNLSGSVEADSISGSDGNIVIGGGEGGKVTVSGKVAAKSASGKGGKITVTGQQVALKGAQIDASGATGGGTVKIGGGWQGTGTTQRAETTSIDAASIIRADATQSGNGGTVVVWSDNLTTFAGLISAQGAGTGIGGEAEVSGKAVLSYTGRTDLSGPGGFGNLLLDPYNVTISSGTASSSTGTTATGDDSVINVSTLVSALEAANVTITTGGSGSAGAQAGNITVADAVTWTSGSRLALSAYGDIAVNANLAGGAGSSIVLRADNSGTGTGTVTFGSGITATASGGVSLYYNPSGNDNSTVNSTSYTAPVNYSANAGASTTITAYMLVNTVHDLQNMKNRLSGIYALGRDIDASATASWNSGAGFAPIGVNIGSPFTGTFDGDGHTISGLTINRGTTDNVALFGYAGSSGIMRNVGLTLAAVTGKNNSSILVGRIDGGTISDVSVEGVVNGAVNAGGLVGYISGAAVTRSSASGSVSGTGIRTGGLVGYSQYGTISNSYAAVAVSGSSTGVGGLVGHGSGTISNSYATGTVTSTGSGTGGLIGSGSATISNSYATGAVTGGTSTGGFIGQMTGGTISTSFFNAETTGQTRGVGTNASASGVTGLTTAQMTSFATFDDAGWDIANAGGSSSVWRIYEGQTGPLLRSFLTAITIGGGAGTKTYDGTASSTSVGTLTYSLADYDASKFLGTAAYVTSSANAGTYTNLTLSGLYSGQTGYDISYAPGTGSLTVGKATLTVTADDASKTYDGQAFSGGNGVTYDGFVNGETSTVLGGTLVYGGTSQNAVNAGDYTLTASGLTSGNYEISYVDGSLTVGKAALEVTVTDATKTYDGLAYSGGNGVSYSGFVNNETASVLGGTLSFGGTSQGAVNAGSYTLTASGLTSGNYDLTYVGGMLTVLAAPAPVPVPAPVPPSVNPAPPVVVAPPAGGTSSSPAITAVPNPIFSLQATQSNPLMPSMQAFGQTPQLVVFAAVQDGTGPSAESGGEAGGSELTTEDLRISAALCAFGPNVAVNCSSE